MNNRKINGKLLGMMFSLHNDSNSEDKGKVYVIYLNQSWIKDIELTHVADLLPLLRNAVSFLLGTAPNTPDNWVTGNGHYRIGDWTVIEDSVTMSKQQLAWINSLPYLFLDQLHNEFGDSIATREIAPEDIVRHTATFDQKPTKATQSRRV